MHSIRYTHNDCILNAGPRVLISRKFKEVEPGTGNGIRGQLIYYIECIENKAITAPLQQIMYKEMPCKEVFKIKTNHSPFFSRPKQLVDIFVDISSG